MGTKEEAILTAKEIVAKELVARLNDCKIHVIHTSVGGTFDGHVIVPAELITEVIQYIYMVEPSFSTPVKGEHH